MTSSCPVKYKSPRKLKDFLIDDCPSCSPNVYMSISLPWDFSTSKFGMELMQVCDVIIAPSHAHVQTQLLRSRSKAALVSISAVQRASHLLIIAIKFLPFASIKTPPRNSSQRKRFNRKSESRHAFASDKLRIKDILRWKSFNNFEETSLPMPTDTTCVTDGSTCINSTSTSSSSSSSTINGSSSWDSHFSAAEEISSICNKDHVCRKEMAIVAKRQFPLKEKEQVLSPISVLESQSIFHHNLPLRLRIQETEENVVSAVSASVELEYEEENDFANYSLKAEKLFTIFKSRNPEYYAAASDCLCLLYDFFREEITRSENPNIDLGFEAESWIKGECNTEFHQYWEQKEACVRDMEKEMRLKFLEENQEMVLDLELCIFDDLIDDAFT